MGIPSLVIGACVALLTINGVVNRRWLGLLITLAVNAAAWIGIFLTIPVDPLVTPYTSVLILAVCLFLNLFGWYFTSRKDAWKDPADIGWGPGPFGH